LPKQDCYQVEQPLADVAHLALRMLTTLRHGYLIMPEIEILLDGNARYYAGAGFSPCAVLPAVSRGYAQMRRAGGVCWRRREKKAELAGEGVDISIVGRYTISMNDIAAGGC